MKLSILIPCYNEDCTQLVQSLHAQLPADCEIVVADDGSTDKASKNRNRSVQKLERVTYWESKENLGRSRIRNALARKAQGDYLLFIDCDARVDSPDFVQRYLACLPTRNVVCGGYYTDDEMPSELFSLRWLYEKSCEPRLTAELRNEHPHQNISTFSIMMPREVAAEHPFDESIRRYGYEDTLLGQELEAAGIGVLHIDNQLTHIGLEPNETYLHKTEESLHTLYDIRNRMYGYSALLDTCTRLRRFHLDLLILPVFRLAKGLMLQNLYGNNPSIKLFQLYKLCFFLKLMHKK